MENNLDYGRNLLDRAEYLRGIVYKPRAPKEEHMTHEQIRQRVADNRINRLQKRQAREELDKVKAQLAEYIAVL